MAGEIGFKEFLHVVFEAGKFKKDLPLIEDTTPEGESSDSGSITTTKTPKSKRGGRSM